MADCQNCKTLASENARLQRENAQLRRVVERQRRKIERLQYVIKRAGDYAVSVYQKAAKAMSEHQPRGKWAFHKGAGGTAREVYNRLNGR